MRVAKIEDFIDDDGNIKQGINFLVHSFYFPMYDALFTILYFIFK